MAEGYIRPLVYLGAGAMGLLPKDNPTQIAIIVWPWGAYLGDEGLERGIRAKVSSYTRHHPNVSMTKSKTCGDYVNSILAKREVTRMGYDEAIMLDTNGLVAECSGENIFIVRRGVLKTPPLVSVLEGITRDSVIRIARDKGIEVVEHEPHARRGLLRRRGLPHRHRRRAHAGARGRRPRDRRRLARPDHEDDPDDVLRRRPRPRPQVRELADAGLI